MKKEAVVPYKREKSESFFEKRMSNILEFAGMGMNLGEIQLAFNISLREEIIPTDIKIYLKRSVIDKRFKEFDMRHKRHLTKNGDLLTDEQRNIVLKLLIAREQITTAEKVKKPQGKDEWEKVVKSMGDIDEPLDIVKKLLGKGMSLSDAMQIAKFEHIPTQEPIVRFAQELAAVDGMISKDKSEFDQLVKICKQNSIQLSHIAYYIVIEASLNARKGIKTRPQDSTLFNRYQELRNMFFSEENEDANEPTELQKLSRLEDSIYKIDDSLVYRVDEVGSYRLDRDGEKLRIPIGVDGGHIVFDSLVLNDQRAASRDRVAAFRLKGNTTITTRLEAWWNEKHPLDVKDQ